MRSYSYQISAHGRPKKSWSRIDTEENSTLQLAGSNCFFSLTLSLYLSLLINAISDTKDQDMGWEVGDEILAIQGTDITSFTQCATEAVRENLAQCSLSTPYRVVSSAP